MFFFDFIECVVKYHKSYEKKGNLKDFEDLKITWKTKDFFRFLQIRPYLESFTKLQPKPTTGIADIKKKKPIDQNQDQRLSQDFIFIYHMGWMTYT